MRKHPDHGRSLLSAAIVVIALATSGCHVYKPYEPTPPTEAAKALDQLKALRSFEDTKTQVQAAVNEITTGASKTIPSITWETLDEGFGGTCVRPYEQTGGQDYFLPDEVAENVAVSEQDWAKILQIAKEAAAKLDATETQVMKDQPGHHDVGFYGPTGIYIKVRYAGNLVVSGYTGCRLPRGKK